MCYMPILAKPLGSLGGPYGPISYALLVDVRVLAQPTVFAPLRVYRPKSRITDVPRAQRLRGISAPSKPLVWVKLIIT